MDFLSQAWLWLYFGAFLMLAELASPGFVVFFFGLAAATVAVLKWCIPGIADGGTAGRIFRILHPLSRRAAPFHEEDLLRRHGGVEDGSE